MPPLHASLSFYAPCPFPISTLMIFSTCHFALLLFVFSADVSRMLAFPPDSDFQLRVKSFFHMFTFRRLQDRFHSICSELSLFLNCPKFEHHTSALYLDSSLRSITVHKWDVFLLLCMCHMVSLHGIKQWHEALCKDHDLN